MPQEKLKLFINKFNKVEKTQHFKKQLNEEAKATANVVANIDVSTVTTSTSVKN